MSSSFVYAREAIEEAARHSFRQFAQYQWSDVIPADNPNAGPGFTEDDWQTVATQIVHAFNRNLHPHSSVDVSDEAKVAAHGKRLIEFQIYLAAKADGNISQAVQAAFLD